MSTWEFLQPWHAVLRESAVQPNCIAADASVRIELCCGVRVNVHTAAHSILIVVLVEEDSRRLREAIELFTLLSFVDNEAFVKLTTSPGYQLNGDFYVAKWRLFSSELCQHLTPPRPKLHSPGAICWDVIRTRGNTRLNFEMQRTK